MATLNISTILQTIPWGTRLLALLLLTFSTANWVIASHYLAPSGDVLLHNHMNEGAAPWLVMSPAESWLYPWTLATSGWVEFNIIELLVSLVMILLAGRYLERVWGARELVRFSLLVIVGSNLIAFGFSWIVYFVLGQEASIHGLPYHGSSGLQVGFLVAFTQLIPEHQVQLFRAIKIRVKALPGIHLLISNILVLILGPSPYILIQFGFFVAWVYLRFFKLSENGEYRGDRSETFAFQYWFPQPIRPYVAYAGNQLFKLAVRARLVAPWDDAPSAGSYNLLPGPGSARAEAERRRALALKALDARLASGPSTSNPTSAAQAHISSAKPTSTSISPTSATNALGESGTAPEAGGAGVSSIGGGGVGTGGVGNGSASGSGSGITGGMGGGVGVGNVPPPGSSVASVGLGRPTLSSNPSREDKVKD